MCETGALTDCEQERAPRERRRGRVQDGVEHVAVDVHALEVAARNAPRQRRLHTPRSADWRTTHILKSFSTSSGVTSPWTRISGGLTLSIIVARRPRLNAGPAPSRKQRPIRNAATPRQAKKQTHLGRRTSRTRRPTTTRPVSTHQKAHTRNAEAGHSPRRRRTTRPPSASPAPCGAAPACASRARGSR